RDNSLLQVCGRPRASNIEVFERDTSSRMFDPLVLHQLQKHPHPFVEIELLAVRVKDRVTQADPGESVSPLQSFIFWHRGGFGTRKRRRNPRKLGSGIGRNMSKGV